LNALAIAAKSADIDDRRAVATVLAAHAGSPLAVSTLRALTGDPDASVRAEATFSLGSIGDATLIPTLTTLSRAGDVDVATNAAAALARIGRRTGAKGPVAEAACTMLADGRALVRANALATLAALGQRCGDGHTERKLLLEDPSDLVRGDAVRALLAATQP